MFHDQETTMNDDKIASQIDAAGQIIRDALDLAGTPTNLAQFQQRAASHRHLLGLVSQLSREVEWVFDYVPHLWELGSTDSSSAEEHVTETGWRLRSMSGDIGHAHRHADAALSALDRLTSDGSPRPGMTETESLFLSYRTDVELDVEAVKRGDDVPEPGPDADQLVALRNLGYTVMAEKLFEERQLLQRLRRPSADGEPFRADEHGDDLRSLADIRDALALEFRRATTQDRT
jgi:hypothetical protein